jgi:multicomponent Na+:H+ antiporter subunit D
VTLVPLTVLVPMVCACGLAALSPFVKRREGALAVGAMIATLTLAVLVLGREASPTTVWFGGWTPRGGVAVGVAFAVDGIGGGMAVFVAALGLIGAVVASRVITAEETAFDAVALIFVAAMIGFCLTGDLFNLFVFFELMSVAAYVLVGYEIRVRSAIEGALTFAVTNTIGSILLLFGIALLYGRTGALNLAQMGLTLEGGPHDTLVVVAFAMVAAGLLVKAAVVPFHLWTADAYAVAPTPICILLAGAFSELGLYGLARVYWTVFAPSLEPHSDALRLILVVAGLATGLLGAVMCAAQHHLKRMLAFATIAQVGLFLVGIGLLSADGIAGAAVWVVGDGLVKAGLFACVAVVQHRYGTVEVRSLHGRARSLWPIGALFVLGALIIASLPPTGSFLGKAVIEDAALIEPGYDWVPAVMLIVTGLLGGTLLRAAARVFWGIGEPPPPDPAGEVQEDEEPDREAGDPSGTSPLLWAPAFVLIAAAVVWGVLPRLLDAAGRAAASFVDEPGYAKAVLEGHVTRHAVPPTLHSPGGTAYLYAAGSLALALVVAALSLRVSEALPRPVAAAVDGLRRIHNGRTGDYVAWAVAGTVVFGGLFALVLQ